jgi:hypothetical protein
MSSHLSRIPRSTAPQRQRPFVVDLLNSSSNLEADLQRRASVARSEAERPAESALLCIILCIILEW